MQRDDIYRQHGWQFARGTGIDSSVPAAWLPAITDLCTKVAALIPEEQREAFQWKDIKEKHGILAVVYHAPAALDDAVASLVEAAESACKTHATIQLIKVTEYRWHEHAIPIWQPVDSRGKPLSGGIVFLDDMPQALQMQFKVWLAIQPLSISRPPLGLPRRSVSYFAQDVVTALEQAVAE
ncbi:hypothetical protein K5M33_16285 [Chromobacterium vaccinii]|nr:hypothetical protein [Chromobacterium vaccinii]MBX9358280.1 hypothetical protein [Chromobacterium vaccinii]